MKPGIKDVAKVAGVSPTTVSRVLNNRGYISEDTRDKVYKAMDEIQYFPNEIARALLNSKTYFIGVIVPSITSPFHGEIVEYAEYYLSKNNYKTLLCNSKNQEDTEREYISMLQRNQVDGILVGTHNFLVDEYKDLNMPIVGIDRFLGDNIPAVASDNYTIGSMATHHLLERNCKHILCIRGDSRLKMPGNQRSKAYMDIMYSMGREPLILQVPFVREHEEKQQLIYDMLKAHPEVDGIFAGDDSLAIISLQIAGKMGLRVPEDLKIIGVDGTKTIRQTVPELTTIRQPSREIAHTAVQLLLDMMNGKPVQSCLDLPVQLLQGRTT